MRRLDVQIPAPDGRSNATMHLPDGDGPWPGVLVFPDAGGARETFRQMGDRLASMGYVAMIPDIYYRAGEWAPFDVATVLLLGLPPCAAGGDGVRDRHHRLLPGRTHVGDRRRRTRPQGRRGGIVPRRQAGCRRRPLEPSP